MRRAATGSSDRDASDVFAEVQRMGETGILDGGGLPIGGDGTGRPVQLNT